MNTFRKILLAFSHLMILLALSSETQSWQLRGQDALTAQTQAQTETACACISTEGATVDGAEQDAVESS